MITTTTRYHSIKRRKITMTVVYHVLVAAASLAMLYPLFWMLSSSFKPNNEIFTTVGNLIPQTFTTENYVNGWRGLRGAELWGVLPQFPHCGGAVHHRGGAVRGAGGLRLRGRLPRHGTLGSCA